MNPHGHDHDFDERDFDEREWQAQERALREARADLRAPADADDRAPAQYRAIADALRAPPPVSLPASFAADVARRAQARAPAGKPEAGLERWLVRALVAAFALSALLALGAYGTRLLAMLEGDVGAQGMQWLVVLAGCVALSWSMDWLRRRAGHDGSGPLRAA
ncbi:MAG TPA: hypothetical protein VM619_03790 [Luteimonas sp.]|nr:hypothetical protein [Luteimonas sp.]